MNACIRRVALVALTAVLVVSFAGCARRGPAPLSPQPRPPSTSQTTLPPTTEQPTVSPVPSPSASRAVDVGVYFTRGEKVVPAPRALNAPALASNAMKALLAGPTAAEKADGLDTQIPAGTKLLGIAVRNGTATVDLSKRFESGGGTLSMTMRIAQVVGTLTRFPNIKNVAFKLDGAAVESIGGEGLIVSPAVDRADYEDAFPSILPEVPLPGTRVARPLVVAGSANVFEAQFRVSVLNAAGKVIADQTVTATAGTGTRGTFRATVPYPAIHAGNGIVRFYEPSSKDGTPINVIDVPVTLQ